MVAHETLVAWIGRCILPWEASVRAYLARASVPYDQIDDIVQEAYSRISRLESFGHIVSPRAYFREVARNILLEQLRRAQIVRFDAVAEMDSLNLADETPNPERTVIAKDDLTRLKGLIDNLPERCRKIFVMRKIEGLSQKEIAALLGISENTVETQVRRGLQHVMKGWAEGLPLTTIEWNESVERKKVAR